MNYRNYKSLGFCCAFLFFYLSTTFLWAADLPEDEVREVRHFIADVIDPAPIIEDSTEQPQKLAFKKHIQALELIILEPGILETSLGFQAHGASRLLQEIKAQFEKLGFLDMKDKIIESDQPDRLILNAIDSISDSKFNDLNFVIEAFAGAFSFNNVGLDKLSLIKVGDDLGKVAQFILKVLQTYHAEQSTADKRFIIATFLRSTMPDDPDEKKLLAVTKASGPFFHKIIQLVGDFVSDDTPEGKKLKDTLNEVKKNLLPINNFQLQKLIKEVEEAGNNQFKITINKTLGVASIGHALLVTVTYNSGKQEKLVLKFIKPGVAERAMRDIKIIVPIAHSLGVLPFFQGTLDDILAELNFTSELANLKSADKIYNSNNPADRVGAVIAAPGFPESPKWLAMSLAPGRSFADFTKDEARNAEEKLDRQIEYLVRGVGLSELTNKWMLQAFFGQRTGLYHADLHAGNVMINIQTDAIKNYLRSKFGNVTYENVTKAMIKEMPKEFYKVTLIDFGNMGYLSEGQRLNVLNFFIATLDEIHSWEGFFEAYTNLIPTKLSSAQESKLKEEVKKIFDTTPNQNALIGKIVTFFLTGEYPPLPPVMANFGRSQAMLNNIFSSLHKDADRLGLTRAGFDFGQSIIEDLKSLLAQGTFLVWQRVDVAGNQLYLNTGNFNAVARYGTKYGLEWIKDKIKWQKVPLGGKCSIEFQCANWSPAGQSGVTCCQGTCQQKKKDWTGVWYCPNVCVGKPFGKAGSCN